MTPTPNPEAPEGGEFLTDAEIDAIAAREHHAGRLPWLGFKQDADGLYSIPLVTDSERALIRACIAGVSVSEPGLSVERIVERAHRLAYRFKMMDPEHGCTTYLFNEARLVEFVRAIEAARGVKEVPRG
jgi:hypothetical protein